MATKPQASVLSQLPSCNLGEDLVTLTQNHIDSLNSNQTLEELKLLLEIRAFHDFYLGGLLNRLYNTCGYRVAGFGRFGPFIETFVGMASSTARSYMLKYSGIAYSRLSSGEVDDIAKDIGWAKLGLFAPYLQKETADEWCEIARQQSVGELRKTMNQELKRSKKLFGEPWAENFVDKFSSK